MKKPALLLVIALISGQHLPRASAQIPGGTSWAGFVIPHSIADPNGDGINIFGLSGLGGTATNLAINTGISQLVPLVRGTIGQLIRPRQRRPYFSESPQAFTNTLRRENNARNARIAAAKEQEKAVEEALKTLQESQWECEAEYADVCPVTSYPVASLNEMIASSENVCGCVPAIALSMEFSQPPSTDDQKEFSKAVSAKLGLEETRVKITGWSSGGASTLSVTSGDQMYAFEDARESAGFTVDLKILPNLVDYFKGQSPLYQPSTLSNVDALLSSKSLDGYGSFFYSVQAPEDVCSSSTTTTTTSSSDTLAALCQ